MKKFFLLLIAVLGIYYLYSGVTDVKTEIMSQAAEISYGSYTNFIPDKDCFWGYRTGEILHYTEEGINDFTIKVNVAEPVIAAGDLVIMYDKGKDTLYGYDRQGEEQWEYKAAGIIEDVRTRPGENIFMLILKDNVFYMTELNGQGKKMNEWVASNNFVMDYDFIGDTVYVASVNTSDRLGGRITAYTRGGNLIWAEELDGLVPLIVGAWDGGISVILDKKVMAISAKGKVIFEKESKADYGCIGNDGSIFLYDGDNLYGLATDGRSLFKANIAGIDGLYSSDKGVWVLSGRSVRLYDFGGKAVASYDAMKDIDYLAVMTGKGKILAVGRSGADLVELP